MTGPADVPRDLAISERLVRPALVVMVASALFLGLWVVISPRGFYDSFPGLGRHWVSADGPYNQHLLRDFGQGQLALAVVLIAALMRPGRFLVRTAACASLVFAVPHLAYHATHLSVYGTADKVGTIVALVIAVLLPAILVFGTARQPADA